MGEGGAIFKTINGGTDWIPQSSGTTKKLNSIYFINDDTGYAVGDTGIILKTTNGGSDWIAQSSGTTSNLNSIYFTDDDTGYAAGDTGIILKTTNGGINWYALSSGTNYLLRSVFFLDANMGYVVGDGGTILKTTNGGGYPVGINDQHQKTNSMILYPNPASNIITIESPAKGSLSIYSTNGQQLLQQTITEPSTTIDVSGLKSGVYLLKFVGEKGVQVGKFIKRLM